MKIEPMTSTPTSRAHFERNIMLVREICKQGKMNIMRGNEHAINGLLRVRMLPNGRIDLLSVDEVTRLTANMIANMDGKKINTSGEEETDDHEE